MLAGRMVAPTLLTSWMADPLQLNQSGVAAGDLKQIVTGNNTTATRIFVIYLLPEDASLTRWASAPEFLC